MADEAIFDLPVTTLDATGTAGGIAASVVLLPKVSLAASGLTGQGGVGTFALVCLTLRTEQNEASFSLPVLQLTAAAVRGVLGHTAPILPVITLTSAGAAHRIGRASFQLLRLRLSARGVTGTIGTLARPLPVLHALGSGVVGRIGSAAFELPVLTLIGAGRQRVFGSTAFVLPALLLDARGEQDIGTAFRTLVLNVRRNALTEYDNFNFNSYTTFGGQVLAAGPDGVFILGEQALDDTDEISARLRSGKLGFGTSLFKRMLRAYLGYSSSGDLLVSTITTEHGQRTYGLPTNYITGLQQRRVPIGRGPKARYWQFEVANVEGSDFAIEDIQLYPTIIGRRVM